MSNIQASLVRSILEKWQSYAWTIQGMGMARTKIGNVGRIHVWDSRLRVPLVSDIHAHPWALRSTIISGELINQRFAVLERPAVEQGELALSYCRSPIATGEGGGLVGTTDEVLLVGGAPEFYHSGNSYAQTPDEIHRSIPQDGTVTLLERQQGEPLQETWVFWPRGTNWVSAEPREPQGDWELQPIIAHALARWSAV